MAFKDDEYSITLRIPRLSKLLVVVLSVAFIFLLGLSDYASGYEMSFSIFYLIPISFAVAFAGLGVGIAVAVASAVMWYVADIYSGHAYSNYMIPVWNSIMRLGYFLLHSFLMHESLKLYRKTKELSFHDALTGAGNWRLFKEAMEREVKKAKRTGAPLTLAYLDLDDFKKMNDGFGHEAGDRLLKRVAEAVRGIIRPADMLARLGGDEFCVMLPETDYESAQATARRIHETLAEAIKSNGWPVTVSLGAVTFSSMDAGIDEMLRMADELMYAVKKSGKNQIKLIARP